jgi:hypothetical protein
MVEEWGIKLNPKEIALNTNQIPPKIYRIIGKEEYDILQSGGAISPRRYGDNRIDITNNPDYPSILKQGKYLVSFKQLEEFDPLAENPRVTTHNVGNDEFYLAGSYSMEHIEKIELISQISRKNFL